jgi:DnaJ-class molecular chaperone
MPTTFQDYYSALGVSKRASEKEIKSAFRKIARESHPDTHPGDEAAEKRFRLASEAYAVLGDTEKRRKYDELGPRWQEYEQWESAGGQGPNPFANYGPRVHYQTFSTDDMDSIFGSRGGGFSDFFQQFFGGAAGAHVRESSPVAQDVEAVADITLVEAYRGTSRTVALTGGKKERRIEVKIPTGINSGARVRARGQAQQGDLYIQVNVLPHARFVRKGDELFTTVSIPLATAIAGGSVTVNTISGKQIALTVAPNTRNGTKLRARGQGMPRSNGTGYGDLIAEVSIQIPSPAPPDLVEWAEKQKTK